MALSTSLKFSLLGALACCLPLLAVLTPSTPSTFVSCFSFPLSLLSSFLFYKPSLGNHIYLHKYKYHCLYLLKSKENGRDISCQFLNHGVLKSAHNSLIPKSEREMTFELLIIIFKITVLIYGQVLTYVFPNCILRCGHEKLPPNK